MDRMKKPGKKREPFVIGYTKHAENVSTGDPLSGFGVPQSWQTYRLNASETDAVIITIMTMAGLTPDQQDGIREGYREDCAHKGMEFDEERFQASLDSMCHQFQFALIHGGERRGWATTWGVADEDGKAIAKEFLQKALTFLKTQDPLVVLRDEDDDDGDDDENPDPYNIKYILYRPEDAEKGKVDVVFRLKSSKEEKPEVIFVTADEKQLRQMFLDAMYRYDPNYED